MALDLAPRTDWARLQGLLAQFDSHHDFSKVLGQVQRSAALFGAVAALQSDLTEHCTLEQTDLWAVTTALLAATGYVHAREALIQAMGADAVATAVLDTSVPTIPSMTPEPAESPAVAGALGPRRGSTEYDPGWLFAYAVPALQAHKTKALRKAAHTSEPPDPSDPTRSAALPCPRAAHLAELSLQQVWILQADATSGPVAYLDTIDSHRRSALAAAADLPPAASPRAAPTQVWTSFLRRTRETARPLPAVIPRQAWRMLNEIEAGACDGLDIAQIRHRYPGLVAKRLANKLTFRYPGQGESYVDLIHRVTPLLAALEARREPVLVISHQAVLRIIYAYFKGHTMEAIPNIAMPLHTLIQLVPTSWGCLEHRWVLGPHPGSSGTIAAMQAPKPQTRPP